MLGSDKRTNIKIYYTFKQKHVINMYVIYMLYLSRSMY